MQPLLRRITIYILPRVPIDIYMGQEITIVLTKPELESRRSKTLSPGLHVGTQALCVEAQKVHAISQ